MGRKLGWGLALLSIASTFFLCNSALAVPFSWTGTVDPNPNQFIRWGSSFSYTHNLTDSSTDSSFVPGQDIITGYSLTLRLYDDRAGWDEFFAPELFYVNLPGIMLPGIMSDGFYNFSMTNNQFGWSLAGIFSLNTSGTYNVTIRSIMGDFFFDSSTLTATGNRNTNTASVPEPAAMVLFGTGLVLFGFIGRKFKHS
jgi:hypothetical protein